MKMETMDQFEMFQIMARIMNQQLDPSIIRADRIIRKALSKNKTSSVVGKSVQIAIKDADFLRNLAKQHA